MKITATILEMAKMCKSYKLLTLKIVIKICIHSANSNLITLYIYISLPVSRHTDSRV